MLQEYVSSVSDVSSECCMCFHMDVAEVDRDVAHVAMVIHILRVYVLNVSTFFRYMLQVHVLKCFSILDVCCKCFI
jgi:hypothetical protein